MRAVPVPVVWGLAVVAVGGLATVAVQRPTPHRPPALGSGPLFAVPPGVAQPAVVTGKRPVSSVSVTLADAGCVVSPTSAPEGLVRFTVTNPGGTGVTETELTQAGGGRILGEAEGVEPGHPSDMLVDLRSGSYALACPGTGAQAQAFAVVATRG